MNVCAMNLQSKACYPMSSTLEAEVSNGDA
jgi:hypothetical protein